MKSEDAMARVRHGRDGEKGVVAVVVALVMVALVAIAGAVIDIGRAVYVRQSMQAAVDAAVLAGSAEALNEKSGDKPDTAKMNSAAAKAFAANALKNSSLVTIQEPGFVSQYRDDATYDDSVVGSVNFVVPTVFGRLVGFQSIPFTIEAVARRPRPAPVELVIVADVTESMNEAFGTTTKIAALKSSATKLVETLMKGQYVKVGLLPVSGLVRLDTSKNYHNPATMESNVNWLKMAPDPNIQDCTAWSNCTIKNFTCYKDGLPYTCPLRSCTTCDNYVKRAYYWDGCVFYRPVPARTSISNPTTTPYYGLTSSAGCAALTQTITDLVTAQQTYGSQTAEAFLKARINALRVIPGGWGTYIPTGLIWGWNMLTTNIGPDGKPDDKNFPLNSGYTPTEVKKLGVRKALVLITDGNNTLFASPVLTNKVNLYDSFGNIFNPGYTPAQQQAYLTQTNNDMATICGLMKSASIEMYVIALQVSAQDKAYKDTLKNSCASGTAATKSDYFFDVIDPEQLQKAFEKIGKSFSLNTLTN